MPISHPKLLGYTKDNTTAGVFHHVKEIDKYQRFDHGHKDFSLGWEKEQLLDIYKRCTEDQRSFLMVDINGPSEKRFRKNFSEIL